MDLAKKNKTERRREEIFHLLFPVSLKL